MDDPDFPNYNLRMTLKDKLKDATYEPSWPPKPPKPEELEAVGLKLNAKPEANANCDQSAKSQQISAHDQNMQLKERYETALKYHQTQGAKKPKVPQPPSLDGKYEPDTPYQWLEDYDALLTFCYNGRESPNAPDYNF